MALLPTGAGRMRGVGPGWGGEPNALGYVCLVYAGVDEHSQGRSTAVTCGTSAVAHRRRRVADG